MWLRNHDENSLVEIEHSSPLNINCSLLKVCCSLWSQVVPEDASKLADFQKIIERTSQFEAALNELNLVSLDAERRLSTYAENIEVHFASRKKIEILAKARNLLLQCNFTIPQVSFDYRHIYRFNLLMLEIMIVKVFFRNLL